MKQINIQERKFNSIKEFARYYSNGDTKKQRQIENRINAGWTADEAIGIAPHEYKKVGAKKGKPVYKTRNDADRRKCKSCGKAKDIKEFPINDKRTDGSRRYGTECKKCYSTLGYERRKKRGQTKGYYSRNKEICKERSRKHYRKNKELLSDHYIKRILTKRGTVAPKDIPLGMIEVKRLFIMIKNELNNEEDT
jgi:hypothetical protein